MHHPICVERGDNCRLGRDGHCASCPHRGQHDARWVLVYRLRVAAGSVENGYPRDQIEPDLAVLLWPEHEREWIAAEDAWVERAGYHASMRWEALTRELLREVHDLYKRREGQMSSQLALSGREQQALKTAAYVVRGLEGEPAVVADTLDGIRDRSTVEAHAEMLAAADAAERYGEEL
jgi:hypothetical protein